MHQELTNVNWPEMVKIKELNTIKCHFVVCGYYGLISFKKQNDKYVITLEVDDIE